MCQIKHSYGAAIRAGEAEAKLYLNLTLFTSMSHGQVTPNGLQVGMTAGLVVVEKALKRLILSLTEDKHAPEQFQ